MKFNLFAKKQEIKEENNPFLSTFSSPFGKIGEGNLALPYVRGYSTTEPYIRFGSDNLYPQLINQMYYTSPLNGSIINFKTNATIGGGYELIQTDLNSSTSGKEKVKEYSFIKINKIDKLTRQITKDLIMHGRICILVSPKKNGEVVLKRVGPEKVRNNELKTIYSISSDWMRSIDIKQYPAYKPTLTSDSIFVYEIDGDAGQDIYPIPQYCSALNDAFLDGETSYLMKSNIINSIFPSFMIKLAKKFGSDAEAKAFKDTIEKAKGAPAAGRILTFVGQTPDQLPTIESIPTNQNDKIFDSTLQRVDQNISRAHNIDPLLMGIRVSGSLGQGNELEQSYLIFEKNVIMPLRQMIEECVNELFLIGDLTCKIKINNYQIVDGQIKDKTQLL